MFGAWLIVQSKSEKISRMSFHVSNMSLTLAISEALREIQVDLFRGPAPHRLHHYTKAPVVESIIANRTLWGTSLADQADQTEVSHTAALVAQLADNLALNSNPFSRDVLRRLPFFMEERKQWIFIACFCDDDNSALHWSDYGDYCLTFPAPWTPTPSLTLGDSQSECWYQRIVYDEKVQLQAIERALRAIARALAQNTRGQNEGPWASAMVDSCARNAAQLLLGLAVGFKRSDFRGEREWRIVCAPRLGNNNSAPDWIDEKFSVNIKTSPRSHVLLHIPRPQGLLMSLLIPPVPFLAWTWNPHRYREDEVQRINRVLISNCRPDLSVSR